MMLECRLILSRVSVLASFACVRLCIVICLQQLCNHGSRKHVMVIPTIWREKCLLNGLDMVVSAMTCSTDPLKKQFFVSSIRNSEARGTAREYRTRFN